MGLVDLPTPDAEPGRKLIGWEEDGQLVGRVAVSRQDDELVLHTLAVTAAPAGEALVRALAETANATRLVALTDEETAAIYRACDFDVRAEDGGFRCVLELDATRSSEPSPAFTLSELEAAVRSAWSAETSDDPATWSPENPARNQCDVTALLVRELLGGQILIANVIRDGRRVERHAWNRLPSGIAIDLTRSQFRDGEQFDTARVGEPMSLQRTPERYELFAARVREALHPPK